MRGRADAGLVATSSAGGSSDGLRAGSLRLQRIELCPLTTPTQVSVTLGGQPIAAHIEPAGADVVIVLHQALGLAAGEVLEVKLG